MDGAEVLEPPSYVTDAEVMAIPRDHWDRDATNLVHLPVGAHHWQATGSRHVWFVTLDALLPRHTAQNLEWRLDEISAYATWFEAPHAGTEDDRIALGGLLSELDRA